MSNNFIYRSVEPLAKKTNYQQNNNIDFTLDFQGQKLVANSLRLSGKLIVKTAASTDDTNIVTNQDICFDSKVGIHNFFEQFSVSFQNQGMINIFQQYGRWVRMNSDCKMDENDFYSSDMTVELRAPHNQQSKTVLKGEDNLTLAATTGTASSFYMKPLICLNMCSGNIRYEKTGQILLSCQLANNLNALFGTAVNANTTYELRDLILHYQTIADDGVDERVVMNTLHQTKADIDSGNGTVTSQVAALANSVSCSFIDVNHVGVANWNNQETENVPNFQEVQFLFNDSSTYVNFPIQDRVEVIDNYVDSMKVNGDNKRSIALPTQMDRFSGFGVGLNWNKYIDFRNNKFTLNIKSDIDNTRQYNVCMFFHGVFAM